MVPAIFPFLLLAARAAAQSGPWPSTPHFFPHTNRKTTVLNGTWSFGFASDPTLDVLAARYSDIATPNLTAVPSCFDIAPPGIKGPRTTVFYRSTHACTPGAPALLRFYAVNFFTRVFADGVELGSHNSPYTPFSFVAPCAASGTREIALMVNNVFNKTLCPTCTGGDFYFWGGIIRPVVVTELPAAKPYYIERVEPLTTDVASGLITVRVAFGGTPPASASLTLAFNGGPTGPSTNAPLVDGVATLAGVTVPDAKPWTLGQGNLFTLTVAEAATGDAFTTRSGLRVLGIAPGPPARLTINGEVVKLKGFNRHHSWPDTGAAVTPEQEATDLSLLLSLSSNYVRGGHYPQSQSWLDMLDEAGMVLWEEALGPGVSTKDILDPTFMAAHLADVASMVKSSVAHPSVIMHGFFNEGPSSDPKACPGYAASSQAIHDLVPLNWRLSTWASDKTASDVCLHFADVVSFNNYPGWYGAPGDVSNVNSTWKRLSDWVMVNHATKPFTVSETGGGGSTNGKMTPPPTPGCFGPSPIKKPSWARMRLTSWVMPTCRGCRCGCSTISKWMMSPVASACTPRIRTASRCPGTACTLTWSAAAGRAARASHAAGPRGSTTRAQWTGGGAKRRASPCWRPFTARKHPKGGRLDFRRNYENSVFFIVSVLTLQGQASQESL